MHAHGLRAFAFAALLAWLAMAATPSTITLTSSANPAVQGQPLTVTATVTSGATGKVTFYEDGVIVGIATVAAGQAVLTTRLLPSGSLTLRAHYGGDSTYAASDSSSLSQTVSALPGNGFQQVVTAGTYLYLTPPIVADFNGDGKPDVVLNQGNVAVAILLGNGDGTFQAAINVGPGEALAVADFNGDGIPDLLVSNEGSLLVLLGNGNGTFRTLNVSAPEAYPASVGDFNGDGKVYIVISNFILFGNGDGTFQSPLLVGGGQATALVVADFNGDGKDDIAFADSIAGTGDVVLMLGNGDGTFRVHTVSSSYTSSLAVGDFNGDGKPDLVWSYNSYIEVALGNGDGTFQTPVGTEAAYSNALAVADFNGDGKSDLALTGYGSDAGIMLSNGDGTFQPPQTYFFGETLGVAAVDFNDDGRSDFLVVSPTGVNTFLGQGLPVLTVATANNGILPGATGTIAITVSNTGVEPTTGTVTIFDTLPSSLTPLSISASGWNCVLSGVISCGRSDPLEPGASYPAIMIQVSLASSAPGVIADGITVSGGGISVTSVTSTDTIILRAGSTVLTASAGSVTLGKPVIVTATEAAGSTGQVAFYDGSTVMGYATVVNNQASFTTASLGSGIHTLRARFLASTTSFYAGSVSGPVTLTVNASRGNGFQPAVTYSLPVVSMLIVSADFNGDGKLDLAVAGSGEVNVMLGNGDGTFQAAQTLTTGITANDMAFGDLNGDSIPDLIVLGSSLVVLLGNGDGTFRAPIVTTVDANRMALADFNGDGKIDVVLNSGTRLAVSIALLPGNGDGTFAAPINYPLPGFVSSVATADFRGIGKADLAIATQTGVSVWLGNGDGTFQPGQSFTLGLYGLKVVAGDLNGDGKPDLALNYEPPVGSGTNGTVLLGNGDGTFNQVGADVFAQVNLAVGNAVGDFNGDGKSDLGGGNLAVLEGNGDGTFQIPRAVPVEGAANALAIGDFNGDGITDMATVVVSGGGTVSNVQVLLGSNPSRINLTVWRPSNGTWYVNAANGQTSSVQLGVTGDEPVVSNFYGNYGFLALDYTIWRPANGTWYIMPLSPDQATITKPWGLPGDIPVPGDYDGDGRTDYAEWRPSNGTWYVILSSNPFNPVSRQWGLLGDIPVVADFDGDGKADYAVWRPSSGTWYIILSGSGQAVTKQWGLPGDEPVAADYDGDGKADYAVWRPSNQTWYVTLSSTGATVTEQWGLPGDIPVPHDYDLDGKDDLAVWRPSTGTWYMMPSASPGVPLIVQWGLPGDVPIYKPPGN